VLAHVWDLAGLHAIDNLLHVVLGARECRLEFLIDECHRHGAVGDVGVMTFHVLHQSRLGRHGLAEGAFFHVEPGLFRGSG
jgi:hypothetical protein